MGSRLIATALFLAVQATIGTGSIMGSVHDETGAPVGGLVAVLFPAEETAWPTAQARGTARRTPVHDGQFEMTGLPAGTYKFLLVDDEAQLESWPSAATLSQLAGHSTYPLSLDDGQIRVSVEVRGSGASLAIHQISVTVPGRVFVTPVTTGGIRPRIPPRRPSAPAPGAISGRVTDADDRPAGGLEVRALRVSPHGAAGFVWGGDSTTTDAEGRYRLAERTAGSYVVVVRIRSSTIGPAATAPIGPALPSSSGPHVGLVATFYGNTPDVKAATPVAVATTERGGIDIELSRAPVFTVLGSIGQAVMPVKPQTFLTLVRLDRMGQPDTLDMRSVFVGADGAFRFDDLVDGDYDLAFSSLEAWGRAHVHVAGRDPDAVVIVPHPVMVVHGQAEFHGTTPPPVILTGSSRFGVTLWADQRTIGVSSPQTPIQSNGMFTAGGAGTGPFRLLALAPAPWFQVAGYVGGVDTLDVAVAAGSHAADGVVVFADHPTAWRVTLADEHGQPVAHAGVIVFSEDARYWATGSRRVQTRTTLESGTCSFVNLPPGKYFAATSPDLTAGTPVSPALLERLKATATPFDVVVGRNGAVPLVAR